MALMRSWYIRTSWKIYDIGILLEGGRQGFGNDCSMSRLAYACCCDKGWLFPPPLYNCKRLCNIPCRGELAPSRGHGNEVLLPLSISLRTFFPSVSLLYEYQVTSALGWLPTWPKSLHLMACTNTSASQASPQKCCGALALLIVGH